MNGKLSGWTTRIIKNFFLSPVNIIFAIAAAYFGAQAYFWEPTFMNRIIFFGIVGLWVFWIVARYMIVLFIIFALIGGGYYAYHQYSTREIRKCEASGGVWNKETKTCEAKVSLIENITNRVNKMLTDFFGKKPTSQNTAPIAENSTSAK